MRSYPSVHTGSYLPKDTYSHLYHIHILIQEYLYIYLSLSQTYTYQISCRSYRASMCTEVPVGTISQNRSES